MAGGNVGLEDGELIVEVGGAYVGGLAIDFEGLVVVTIDVEGVGCGLVGVGLMQEGLSKGYCCQCQCESQRSTGNY